MKESELFEPVKKFLIEQGCSEVYGEVMNCDVLGIQRRNQLHRRNENILKFSIN